MERNNRLSVLLALIFSMAFALSVYVLVNNAVSSTAAVIIIGLNVLLLGIYTVRLIRNFSLLDEVQIRIQLEAVSIAFVLSLALVMVFGLIELVDGFKVDHISHLYVFPAFFLFYLIGLIISHRKYR